MWLIDQVSATQMIIKAVTPACLELKFAKTVTAHAFGWEKICRIFFIHRVSLAYLYTLVGQTFHLLPHKPDRICIPDVQRGFDRLTSRFVHDRRK